MRTPGHPLTVLLVEDNADHAELARRALADVPVRTCILQATDGEAALDCALGRGDVTDGGARPRPDLVLLDLRLPGLSGLDVLREIRRFTGPENLPVVVLTTSTAEQDLALALAHQANACLAKPLEPDAVTSLFQKLGFLAMAPVGPAGEAG